MRYPPKQGFGVPIHEWLLGALGDVARAELGAFLDRTDHFERKEVFRLLETGRAEQVWYMLNFALWHKEFLD